MTNDESMEHIMDTMDLEFSGKVKDIAWSPDGKQFAVAASESLLNQDWKPKNDRISIWDRQSLQRIHSFEGMRDIIGIFWRADGTVLSVSRHRIRMWELRNENPIYDTELMFHDDNKHGIGKLDTVVWSPDGKKCGMFNGEIGSKSFVYTLETEECASRGTYALAWSSDGKWLATSTKGEVTLWDDSTGRKMGKIEFPEKTSFYNMKWSPTGNNIAICAMTYPRRKPKRTIVILNPSKGTISRKISVGGYLIPEWNSTGTLVFGIRIGPYASFPFWDIKKGKIMHEPLIDIEGGILSSVVSPKLSPDGISIIGAINNQLYVCDTSLYIGTPQTEFIIPPSSMTGYEGSERQLEDVIEKDPSLIGFGYRLLGRQVEAGDGRIDLLLESPDGAIVVGELKKEKADDTTAGQILRYLVWVEENYPRSVQPRGIIVASEFSNNLKLAIRASKYKIRLLSSAIIWDNYSSNGGS